MFKKTQPAATTSSLTTAQLAAVRSYIAATPAAVLSALANATVAKAASAASETHFLFRQPALA